MKSTIHWLLPILCLFLTVPQSTLAQADSNAVCCGNLGGAGEWGGNSQYVFCMSGPCIDNASQTISVSYQSTGTACPHGTFSCLVTPRLECCGWDCSTAPECGLRNQKPSCCNGYCGNLPCQGSFIECTHPTEIKLNPACDGLGIPPQINACCDTNAIQVDVAMLAVQQAHPSWNEWIVSYGYPQ
jgi:hypothetical protein